jgi:hypothetical protein
MTRKRSGLGDLLREEVGKSDGEATTGGAVTPDLAPANPKTTPKKTASPKATPAANATPPSPDAPDPELQDQITALQAQLASQQTQLQELNQAQALSRQLESELAVAKQTILQLSSQNQAAPAPPAKTPVKPPAKPVTPAPNRQPLDLQPAPTPAPVQASTQQPYRFERIGWKPLSNHLIQPEAPSTKLSDADLGWVD